MAKGHPVVRAELPETMITRSPGPACTVSTAIT